jgi:hypothetical protein
MQTVENKTKFSQCCEILNLRGDPGEPAKGVRMWNRESITGVLITIAPRHVKLKFWLAVHRSPSEMLQS